MHPVLTLKAADGLLTPQDWTQGLEGRGYTAGVGEPINLFYPEILKVSTYLVFGNVQLRFFCSCRKSSYH